jgi:RNA polymerase sigma-70 factor, ECF subfamily
MSDFDLIYRQHANDVYRFALWLCGDAAQAEDVTAETFARAFTGHDPARATSVKAYLLTIARRLVWKWRARAAREEMLGTDVADTGSFPDRQLALSTELGQVMAALNALPEVDRSALLLRVEEDLSYEDIAAVLEISTSAAKVKVHRARLRLALARDQPVEPTRTNASTTTRKG